VAARAVPRGVRGGRAAPLGRPVWREKSRAPSPAVLGTVHVHTGDIAVGSAVQPHVHDVLGLRRLLQPWNDTAAVRDLDARLSAVA
jgi:hypothetical protein